MINNNAFSFKAIEYFKKLYFSPIMDDKFPNVIPKKIMTKAAKRSLDKYISMEEIYEAVFKMHDESSLDLDGFGAKFYKIHWNNIKDELFIPVNEAFLKGKFIQLNHTFICLIPKKQNASATSDFRPISLCNVLYKVITSILCNRLKSILLELISENQNAFIVGRYMVENNLLAYEMVENFNQDGADKLCSKIELQKAYDKISREFIIIMLRKMNFPPKFCNFIFNCISSPTFFILINGIPCGFIRSNKGLRYGDPLSPYLFAVAMEYCSISLDLEYLKANLKPIYNNNPIITHLIYADDLLVFYKYHSGSIYAITNVLELLSEIGLNTNE